MSNMKLYIYIIKNAATKKTGTSYNFFLILAAKKINMTKLIKLLCLPIPKHVQ